MYYWKILSDNLYLYAIYLTPVWRFKTSTQRSLEETILYGMVIKYYIL